MAFTQYTGKKRIWAIKTVLINRQWLSHNTPVKKRIWAIKAVLINRQWLSHNTPVKKGYGQ
jgi:hypothetical protein